MVDQASTEMAAVVQTPPVSDSRQGYDMILHYCHVLIHCNVVCCDVSN